MLTRLLPFVETVELRQKEQENHIYLSVSHFRGPSGGVMSRAKCST